MASDDRFRVYVRNVRNSLGKWTIRAALESMGCYNLVSIQTCRKRWSDSRNEGEHMSMFLSFGDAPWQKCLSLTGLAFADWCSPGMRFEAH